MAVVRDLTQMLAQMRPRRHPGRPLHEGLAWSGLAGGGVCHRQLLLQAWWPDLA
jgi:hypothetical protein